MSKEAPGQNIDNKKKKFFEQEIDQAAMDSFLLEHKNVSERAVRLLVALRRRQVNKGTREVE